MALRVDSPLDTTVEVSAMSAAEKPQEADNALPRYPKRKRNEVRYFESDIDDFDIESETEHVPIKKVCSSSNYISPPLAHLFQKAKVNSRSLPKKKIFPFMKLPAELRNKIYEECLTDGDAIFVTSKQRSFRRAAVRTTQKECTAIYGYRRRRYRWNHLMQIDEPAPEEPQTFKPLIPNILAVSKTIYDEAVRILYRQPIIIADTRALLDFTTMMSPRTAGMLRDITILTWCGSRAQKCVNYPAMALLAAVGVVNLERLDLDCRLGNFWYWAYPRNGRDVKAAGIRLARKVYRDCYPWLYAVGAAKGDIDGAFKVLRICDDNFGPRYHHNENEDREKHMNEAKAVFETELKRLMRK